MIVAALVLLLWIWTLVAALSVAACFLDVNKGATQHDENTANYDAKTTAKPQKVRPNLCSGFRVARSQISNPDILTPEIPKL